MRTRTAAIALLAIFVAALTVQRGCARDVADPDSAPARAIVPLATSAPATSPPPGRQRVRIEVPVAAVATSLPPEAPASDEGVGAPAPQENGDDGPLTAAGAEEQGPLNGIMVTVLTPEGHGAAFARVRLYEDHPHGGYSSWREVGEHVADGDGSVAIGELAGQQVQLRATLGEAVAVTEPIRRYRGRAQRDLTLRLVPGTRRRGVAVDADGGAPIAGATVSLFHAPWRHSVETAADGTFVSEPVVPTEFDGPSGTLVSAWAPGYAESRSTVVGGRLRVVLTAGTTVRARIVDADGLPVAGRAGYVKTDGGRRDYFRSDAQGRVEVEALAVDPDDTLEVWPAGGQVARFAAAGQRLDERDLGDVVARPSGSVSGIIVDAHGRPVHRARVGIRSVDGGIRLDVESTDIDGLFELENVGDGDHVITARAPGDGAPETRVERVRAGDRGLRVVLRAGPRRD